MLRMEIPADKCLVLIKNVTVKILCANHIEMLLLIHFNVVVVIDVV